MENKRKIIMDVDTGTDDTVALLLAILSKKFDILGITTVWGNQPVEYTSMNTLRVVEYLNEDIPVYKGCSEPMTLRLDKNRFNNRKNNIISYIDENGIEKSLHPKVLPIPDPKGKIQDKHACSFLVETLLNAKDKITIVPVGPCTNIGMAIRMEPKIVEHIEEVVFMGGSVGMGNVTPSAEANFWNDPEAVKIILNSGVKCKIATLNATHSASIPMKNVEKLKALNTKAGKLAADVIKIRADVSKHLGWSDGQEEIIHDGVAIAYLIDPSIITDIRKENVDISIDIQDEGTLLLDKSRNSDDSNIEIMYKADRDKYFNLMLDLFSRL